MTIACNNHRQKSYLGPKKGETFSLSLTHTQYSFFPIPAIKEPFLPNLCDWFSSSNHSSQVLIRFRPLI